MDEKLLDFLCRDKKIKEAHEQKKDIYSTLASMLFNCPYEKCLDTGSSEDKYRRLVAKSLALRFYFGDFEDDSIKLTIGEMYNVL